MNEKGKVSIIVNTREDRTRLILRTEEYVRKKWADRARAQGYKDKHITTAKYRVEFMLGMVAAMDYLLNAEETGESSITPKLFFELMRG